MLAARIVWRTQYSLVGMSSYPSLTASRTLPPRSARLIAVNLTTQAYGAHRPAAMRLECGAAGMILVASSSTHEGDLALWNATSLNSPAISWTV
jgi:hypothetical protein